MVLIQKDKAWQKSNSLPSSAIDCMIYSATDLASPQSMLYVNYSKRSPPSISTSSLSLHCACQDYELLVYCTKWISDKR